MQQPGYRCVPVVNPVSHVKAVGLILTCAALLGSGPSAPEAVGG